MKKSKTPTPISDKFNNKTIMTEAEWLAKGVELFGEDKMTWKFRCPICGYVACGYDYKALKDNGANGGHVGYSCIGRFVRNLPKREANGPGPCDYAGGGLIQLNPVTVIYKDGRQVDVFEFATEESDG